MFQAVDVHPDIDEAAQGMKEAVRDLGQTLEEAASETGVVSGLIDSIGKALAEVRSHFILHAPTMTEAFLPARSQ